MGKENMTINPKGSITDVGGITVGSHQDLEALTGCTVILTGKDGAVCGVDVCGSAPGTRETDLLSPINMIEKVHSVLLSGGSAYGLEAAGGVMRYLEENRIGYQAGNTLVPIVPGAVLFDLEIGNGKVRPDADMGYKACGLASLEVKEGNAGAGAGATVGKIKGYDFCTKSGLGTASIRLKNGLTVGAIMAVNAFGDVYNQEGQIIAGNRDQEGALQETVAIWEEFLLGTPSGAKMNTTIGVVACNARLTKSQATKIAQMAQNGLARVIKPVHTMFDGDTIFALGTGFMDGDVNIIGYLAQEAVAEAIIRAVSAADTIHGYRSAAWR